MSNQALILIDIQNDYFDGGKFPLDQSKPAVENAARLLASFRKNNLPVVHIQHIATIPDAPFFEKGTQGVNIHPLVTPKEDEPVVIKHFPNSFKETTLQQHLNELNVDSLVITGMMSNMCVDSTTRAAADLGYTCTVVHDACAAASLEFEGTTCPSTMVHAAFMAALKAAFATMKSTDELIK